MGYLKTAPIKYMAIYIDAYDRDEKVETFITKEDMGVFCRSDKVYSVINTYSLEEI